MSDLENLRDLREWPVDFGTVCAFQRGRAKGELSDFCECSFDMERKYITQKLRFLRRAKGKLPLHLSWRAFRLKIN